MQTMLLYFVLFYILSCTVYTAPTPRAFNPPPRIGKREFYHNNPVYTAPVTYNERLFEELVKLVKNKHTSDDKRELNHNKPTPRAFNPTPRAFNPPPRVGKREFHHDDHPSPRLGIREFLYNKDTPSQERKTTDNENTVKNLLKLYNQVKREVIKDLIVDIKRRIQNTKTDLLKRGGASHQDKNKRDIIELITELSRNG